MTMPNDDDLPTDFVSEPAPPPRRTPPAPPQRSRSAKRGASGVKPKAPTRASTTAAVSGRKAMYKEGLEGILQLVAGVTVPFAPADSAALLAHGDNVSEAVADLGATDERIGALLDKIVQVGPYGAVVAAIAPMLAQIAVNHGALPAGVLGTVQPNELVMGVLGSNFVKGTEGESADNQSGDEETASHNVHA